LRKSGETLRRVPLGDTRDFAGRQHVYEGDLALEVDDFEGYAGRRRRVFYDEVLLVTRHRRVGWPFVLVAALFAGLLGIIALGMALAQQVTVALGFLLLGVLPLLVLAVLRVVVKMDVVTVYGKRSQARVQFWLRRERALKAFQSVCARVRQAQERAG
jgi:hypothetical protein